MKIRRGNILIVVFVTKKYIGPTGKSRTLKVKNIFAANHVKQYGGTDTLAAEDTKIGMVGTIRTEMFYQNPTFLKSAACVK